ncbi:hypothetical protein AB0F30_16870 [Streptomyces sp. NPDC029006]|uniref:hypothetical protein n=1 Tax=Streptomyces sp. NPDC029006 TaxID=3155467 RepID=UPI0033C8E36F
MAMTAAEHFEKAEELLDKTANHGNAVKGLLWAIRAQAHLNAARLLHDIETGMTTHGGGPGSPARRTGLTDIAENRRTSNH